ncbi:Uncharacterised protein [Chromobacterium violaceum]|uniref:Uncharacterized protein n=1 Tax=Chromobacterium violaceum TaxID=536 RepID=A0A3S4IJH8_CHRVL|nr:Uncharacterised protein [Chromobacterium violaceum]
MPARLQLCGWTAPKRCLPPAGWQGETARGEACDWRSARRHGGYDFAHGDLAANRYWRDWRRR